MFACELNVVMMDPTPPLEEVSEAWIVPILCVLSVYLHPSIHAVESYSNECILMSSLQRARHSQLL